MSFLSFFSGNGSQPVPSQPAASAPAPTTTVPSGVPSGTPEGANPFSLPATAPEATSPVPEFKTLWDPVTAPAADPNAPKAPTKEDQINRTIEAARQIDFTKVIPADTMAKIAAGGADAQTAFAEAINLVNQATYAQSAFAANQIAEQAVAKAREDFQKALPDIIRQHNIHDTLRGEDPRYQDPEIAPLLKAIDQQITIKFPQATAAQINTMRTQYLDRVTGKINPKAEPTPTKDPRNGDVDDWDALMTRSTYS